MDRALPLLRPDKNTCDSPHVVILGAGASRAACPDGDARGRKFPVMADLLVILGLDEMLREAGIDVSGTQGFEEIYQQLVSDGSHPDLVRRLEATIRSYFEAIQIPDHATEYDRLLLSLRAKDVIATFNWDPLLAQAFMRNAQAAPLPRILFLHGNVAVGACVADKVKGFSGSECPRCGRCLDQVPLLYPIRTKGYDRNPFIQNEWVQLRAALEAAYLVTIFGYAAPASDVEAKSLMLDAWGASPPHELGEVEIVDIKPRSQLDATWAPFAQGSHYSTSADLGWLYEHARRSCDHFALMSLQQRICRKNPLPETADLAVLHAWAKSLVEEEDGLYHNGTPLPC